MTQSFFLYTKEDSIGIGFSDDGAPGFIGDCSGDQSTLMPQPNQHDNAASTKPKRSGPNLKLVD